MEIGVTLLISWHAGVPKLFPRVDLRSLIEGSEGAEIIPHELERYHERVRSRYEIIRNHPYRFCLGKTNRRLAISRIQASKLHIWTDCISITD